MLPARTACAVEILQGCWFELQDKQHKRKAAAAVLPVRVGDEGMALESSFKDGLKNEVLRSLCQLVNSSELALEASYLETPQACSTGTNIGKL